MIEEIIKERERLDRELRNALSTMEKKETVNEIKKQIKVNQSKCPHFDSEHNFNLTWVDDTCPYCGKKHIVR